jgi:urea transport system ATP-binding protein
MLETRDLTLHYGGSQILNGISIRAETGEVTCVMGTNGVGKTSLMKAISGNHARSGGTLSLAGQEVPVLPAHRLAQMGIGYVPQGRMIFPLLTVRENLETGFACLPKDEHAVPDRIFELFPVLKDMENRRGGDLSGGAAAAAGHRARADRASACPAHGRADGGHSAQHHPADRAGDPAAA